MPTKSAAAGATPRPVSAVRTLIIGSGGSLAFGVCTLTKHKLLMPAEALPRGGRTDNWFRCQPWVVCVCVLPKSGVAGATHHREHPENEGSMVDLHTALPVLIGAPLVGLCPVPCVHPLIAQTTLQALLDISA